MLRQIDVTTGVETEGVYTQKEIDARIPTPPKTLEEKRRDFYDAENLTQSRYTYAHMQFMLEGDSTALDAYKAERIIARAKPEFPT